MRLATKLFNASKFTLMQMTGPAMAGAPALKPADITEPLDRAWVERMKALAEASRKDFAGYEYSAMLLYTETAFWDFCDNYLELVKNRAYSGTPAAARSACATLEWTLSVFLRLLAPFLPFITEEVWGWSYAAALKQPSVHKAAWPVAAEMAVVTGDQQVLDAARKVLEAIRTKKAAEKRSVKWPVTKLTVDCGPSQAAALKLALEDVLLAGCVDKAGFTLTANGADDKEPAVGVELGAV
jgi:valyl-tRNA synthetase